MYVQYSIARICAILLDYINVLPVRRKTGIAQDGAARKAQVFVGETDFWKFFIIGKNNQRVITIILPIGTFLAQRCKLTTVYCTRIGKSLILLLLLIGNSAFESNRQNWRIFWCFPRKIRTSSKTWTDFLIVSLCHDLLFEDTLMSCFLVGSWLQRIAHLFPIFFNLPLFLIFHNILKHASTAYNKLAQKLKNNKRSLLRSFLVVLRQLFSQNRHNPPYV